VSSSVVIAKLLSIFAEGTAVDRLSLSRFEAESRNLLADNLESVARSQLGGADSIRAHATLAVVARTIWRMVPPGVFGGPTPDFKSVSEDAIKKHLGDFHGSEHAVRNFSVILRRIRNHHRNGRRTQSLDLDLIGHREIMDRQGCRCNHCLYEFGSDYYRYTVESDDIPVGIVVPFDREVTLDKTFRRPELDHIIPVILGGDGDNNWQILCASCNRGKSDSISYTFGVNSAQSMRISDLFELNTGKRYSIIARVREFKKVFSIPGDGKYYRVLKIEFDKYANVDNLTAEYL
jgi:hypothetical protein